MHPGKASSIHLAELPEPSVKDVPDGRGVLVEVLRVGVDGTDKEIIDAKYGAAPPGDDFLVTGHENFGRVLEVGPNVPTTIKPGGLVVSTVRRPGHSLYDEIGLQDFTTDDVYYERGINLLHGYLTERYVEDSAYVVPLAESLHEVGVLLEPTTIAEKGSTRPTRSSGASRSGAHSVRPCSARARSVSSRRSFCGCAGSRSSAARSRRRRT